MGHVLVGHETETPITATLASTETLSESIKTFNFELSQPVSTPLPGGFGVFDFSNLLDSGYRHMNEANPQLVNEDYVRTWTISNTPVFDPGRNEFAATNQVSVTVKNKPGGLMSNVIHANANKLIEQRLPVEFKGCRLYMLYAGYSECSSKCFIQDALDRGRCRHYTIYGDVGRYPPTGERSPANNDRHRPPVFWSW